MELTRGQVLFHEGEALSHVFLLQSGVVLRCKLVGNKLINSVTEEYKSYFPGKVIYEDSPKCACLCSKDCWFLKMSKRSFNKLCLNSNQNP